MNLIEKATIRHYHQHRIDAYQFGTALDAASFPEHDLLIGHDLDGVVAFCYQLSTRIKVIRGYLVDDFTLFLYRG